MKLKRLRNMVGVISIGVILVGCSGEDKEVKKEIEELQTIKEPVLNFYEDDRLEPYLYEDKSEEDLKREMVEQLLGIQSKNTPLLQTGIMKDQGLLVESGIDIGNYIPKFTSLPQKDDTRTSEEVYWENTLENSLKQFSKLLLQNPEGSSSESNYIDETALLYENIEKRKDMIGKEKDFRDLDLWNFNKKIEDKYKDELSEIRNTISERRELDKAKNSVEKLKEKVESVKEQERLEKELKSIEENQAKIIDNLLLQEEKLREQLDTDKDLTDEERKGITEKDLDSSNGEEDTEDNIEED